MHITKNNKQNLITFWGKCHILPDELRIKYTDKHNKQKLIGKNK